ncbi:MAG: rhodanese-like domain-containing protein [Gammaproteobacteria bacterium]|nr:rhodanese-like domain-containing protein [Gammaproteobacteria bacterium]
MKKLTISSAELVARAKQQIKEISSSEAIALHNDSEIVIVDIRDVRERQREGFIPNSIHAPRGMIEFWVDPGSPYFKDIFAEPKRFIFHCASGWRSALTVATLHEMGFEAEHIEDGFKGWVSNGGPVTTADKQS